MPKKHPTVDELVMIGNIARASPDEVAKFSFEDYKKYRKLDEKILQASDNGDVLEIDDSEVEWLLERIKKAKFNGADRFSVQAILKIVEKLEKNGEKQQ